MIFPVDLWREAVIELECKQHNFRGKKDEKQAIQRSLSLSANPKHLIKGVFYAAQRVFAEFGVKNHTFGNNKFSSYSIKSSGLLRVARNDVCSVGRSMIEMLGVLAIIGVLSVGGIAGYSKAMEKWKIDKATEEYSHIIFGMLQHIDDVRKLSPQSGYTGLADLAIALNLIPNSWNKIGDKHFMDAYGNMVQVQARAENLVFDIFIGGIQSNNDSTSSPGWSPRLCESLISNLAQPLHSAVNIVNTWQSGKGGIYYRGDAYCGGNIPCVSSITLNNIHEMCKHCDGSRECCITLEF